ncbi:MAG: RluA family pseudouridine synthase [Lachnospiraceae bacterium]|jgi:23S rRNA pseudouridine1911/1915/1917 synthase|nr:RluA family pseudouridine synthase [Lachnospiraceae bacterium]
MRSFEVIFEDNEIIVVYKPAMMATQTAGLGRSDLVSELKNYLAGKNIAGNRSGREPYLGVIHRLDQPVEGLLVFAKTKTAAAELSRQNAERSKQAMQKIYYAVVSGVPDNREGELRGLIGQDKWTNRSFIIEGRPIPNEINPREAHLFYRMMDHKAPDDRSQEGITLMEIRLGTGRHHQIRVQMAHARMPLLGDNRYGNERSKEQSKHFNCRQIALCAGRLKLRHPVSGLQQEFTAQPHNEIFKVFSTFFSS